MKPVKLLSAAMMVTAISCLSACFHDDDDDDDMMDSGSGSMMDSGSGSMMNENMMDMEKMNYQYQLTFKNLSYNQPLSPLAVIVDTEKTAYWAVGDTASTALEQLAESGDNTELLAMAEMDSLYVESATGLLLPATSQTITVSYDSADVVAFMTIATMLVNSNDAFTGVQAVDLSMLAVGEKHKITLMTYDAGTEANSELSGTIPGPADGGEGFNAARDDVDFVSMHPGVVANMAEHPLSVLNSSHRFDGPIAELIIKRMQ
ncbi:MAG: hypothetical protein HRU20_03055 [Pseudomonadales bacterium]|nr:hypothetical protein [Pseudomonadales bacterium]